MHARQESRRMSCAQYVLSKLGRPAGPVLAAVLVPCSLRTSSSGLPSCSGTHFFGRTFRSMRVSATTLLDATNPGTWMLHCHNLQHVGESVSGASGLTMVVVVEP